LTAGPVIRTACFVTFSVRLLFVLLLLFNTLFVCATAKRREPNLADI
jgi:hypothetical protein